MAKQSPKDPKFRCNICKEYYYAPEQLVHYQCPNHGYLCEKHVFTKDSFLDSLIDINADKIKENYIRYRKTNNGFFNEQKLLLFLVQNKDELFRQFNIDYFDFDHNEDWPNGSMIFKLKATKENIQCCNIPLYSEFTQFPYNKLDYEFNQFRTNDTEYKVILEKSGDFEKFVKSLQVVYCNKKTAKYEWNININKWIEIYI